MTQLTKAMIQTLRDFINTEYEKFKTEFGGDEIVKKIYKRFCDRLERIDYQVENGVNMNSEIQKDFWRLKEAATTFLSIKINKFK